MNPVTNLIRCFVCFAALVLLDVGLLHGQYSQTQFTLPMPDPDAPPELAIPSAGSGTRDGGPRSVLTAPQRTDGGDPFVDDPIEVIPHGTQVPTYEEYCDECHGAYDLWDPIPVATESTGTWIDRGFYYANAEAVLAQRMWNRNDRVGAFQAGTNRQLSLEGNRGVDTAVRFTLGRFLYRDIDNRDQVVEFTAYGGGDWDQDNSLLSSDGGSLTVNPGISGGNQSFNGAQTMRVTYTSRFNSFELNYRVKQRMRKDQMAMLPSGEWVRRASPTFSSEYLAGLRYLELRERFDWTATDIPLVTGLEEGSYLINTDNRMTGLQLGAGCSYDTGRWGINFLGKAGAFFNDTNGNQALTYTDNPDLGFAEKTADEQISINLEGKMTGRWHLRPNLSLKASIEVLYLTSVALAPQQVSFAPANTLGTTGASYYQGFSWGLEGYW